MTSRANFLLLSILALALTSTHHSPPSFFETPDANVFSYRAPERTQPIRLHLARDKNSLVLLDGGVVARKAPWASVAKIRISGPNFTDTTLSIDYSTGSIDVPIDYSPGSLGAKTDNRLIISGGIDKASTHYPISAHSGLIRFGNSSISYHNLTPILDFTAVGMYTFNVTSSVVNIVDGTSNAGNPTTLVNDGSTSQFEQTTIQNKTSVILNSNTAGASVSLNNPHAAQGMTSLGVNDAAGGAQINVAPMALPLSVTGFGAANPSYLSLDFTGTTNPAVTITNSNANGVSGSFTFSNRAAVSFTNVFLPAPTVSSVNPNNGPVSGGTNITILGSHFIGTSSVTIGGTPVTTFTVTSDTSLSATTAQRLPAASGLSVLVTTPGGTSASNTLFSYAAVTQTPISNTALLTLAGLLAAAGWWMLERRSKVREPFKNCGSH